MRILVTGGLGFVGSHLVESLLNRGFEVTVLDNLSKGHPSNINGNVGKSRLTFVEGDVRDRKVVQSCTNDADSIVHLAAIASVPYSIQNPIETNQVNVEGTLNLLEACKNDGIEKFVCASSCAVYGDAKRLPISEDHPLAPSSPYAESKVAAEQYCHVFRERYGLQTICVRAFNIYGPGQQKSEYGSVLSQFIGRLENGKPPIIYGDGDQSRDFIHIDDVVTAIVRILEHSGWASEVYNLGSGRAITINQLASTLQHALEKDHLKPVYMPPRAGDIRQSQADMRRIGEELGVRPSVSVEEGLERLVITQPNGSQNCGSSLPL